MRVFPFVALVLVLFTLVVGIFQYFLLGKPIEMEPMRFSIEQATKTSTQKFHITMENIDPMRLVVVSCGDRINETLVMVKSAVALSTHHLIIHIFTEKENHQIFKTLKEKWPVDVQKRMEFILEAPHYPKIKKVAEWQKLFKKCASLRLFLPVILSHIDAIVYVDTDILFMGPFENLWNIFHQMNSSQMAAMTPESEESVTGWYNRFAKHPYAGPLGMNSGVMLMNLTRQRKFSWHQYLEPIYDKYSSQLAWGDQDIINIIFHHHMDKLFVMHCSYNYRPDHCIYGNSCKLAENGVHVLHGSRQAYHQDKYEPFQSIYEAWQQYDLETNLSLLRSSLSKKLLNNTQTKCGQYANILWKLL